MVSGPRLEAPAGLLARWGIPAEAELARAERGSNNQTFAVAHGGRRWVLRISQNLSAMPPSPNTRSPAVNASVMPSSASAARWVSVSAAKKG